MKINRLYIRGFGKFKDFSVEFSEGLNLVYGANESGKSTLMAFIKASLYGLKGGRVASTKRYMPWKHSSYGGYINLELDDGSIYRIDRSFDNGSAKVYDSSFNDVTCNFAENKDISGITERLIGINESLFERTVYVSQLGTRIDSSSSKDLIDRISNLSQSGSEDISFKTATNALREALKQQVGTVRSYTRPLDITTKRIAELKEEINLYNIGISRLLDIDIRMEGLIRKEKLFSDILEVSSINIKIQTLYEKEEELGFLSDAIKQCNKNINSLSQECDQLEQKLNNMQNTKKNWVMTSRFFSMVGAIATISVGLFKPTFLALPAIFTITFFILWLILFKNEDSQLIQQQLFDLVERLSTEKNQCEQFIKRSESINLNFNKNDIGLLEAKIEVLVKEIDVLSVDKGTNLSLRERELITQIMEQANEHLYMEISNLKAVITEQLQQERIAKAKIEAETKRSDRSQDLEILYEELAKLEKQKRSLTQRGEALNIAINTLEEASNHVQKKYIPIMNQVLKDTFSNLTAQKYSEISAGENLNIVLSDPEEERIIPVSMLSNGTIDQLYLSLRVAISETVLKKNEGLPFIMDEPFAQYDDDRTIDALSFIYNMSKKQQIIIFTCKQREVELISQYPCKICSLTQ